ncbi:hypothetical protein MRX96_012198 [Rhipicephalus microplus]
MKRPPTFGLRSSCQAWPTRTHSGLQVTEAASDEVLSIGGQASGAVHGFEPSGRPFPAASRCRRRGGPLPGSAPACWDRLCRRTGFFSRSTPGERGRSRRRRYLSAYPPRAISGHTRMPPPRDAAFAACRRTPTPAFQRRVRHSRGESPLMVLVRPRGGAVVVAYRRMWRPSEPAGQADSSPQGLRVGSRESNSLALSVKLVAGGLAGRGGRHKQISDFSSSNRTPSARSAVCLLGIRQRCLENFLKERLRHCLHEDTLSNPESTPKYAYRLVASLAQELLPARASTKQASDTLIAHGAGKEGGFNHSVVLLTTCRALLASPDEWAG